MQLLNYPESVMPPRRPHRPFIASVGARVQLLAPLALAACSSESTAPGVDDGEALGNGRITAADVDNVTNMRLQAADAFSAPIYRSVFGGLGGFVPVPSVTSISLLASLAEAAPAIRSAVGASAQGGAAREPFVDPKDWGRVFVWRGVTTGYGWKADSTRRDAPARGARYVAYERLAECCGTSAYGPKVVGHVDVIDSSTAAPTVGRVNIYDAAHVLVGTFRLVNAYTESESGATVRRNPNIARTGTLGVSPRIVVYADTAKDTVTHVDGKLTASTLGSRSHTRADFLGYSAVRIQTNQGMGVSPASGAPETFELTIRADDHVVRVNVAAVQSGVPLTHQLRYHLDGKYVAKNCLQAGTLTTCDAAGNLSKENLRKYLFRAQAISIFLPTGYSVGAGIENLRTGY